MKLQSSLKEALCILKGRASRTTEHSSSMCCFLKLTLIERKGQDVVTRDDKTDRFVSACGMQNLKLTNENMGNMNGILKCSVYGDL